MTAPFIVRPPEAEETPLVVSIPHTGTAVPAEVTAQFASEHIAGLPETDWYLHHLYDFLPQLGATTLYATFSRYVVDLNRPPTPVALYPGRIESGVIPLQTMRGEAIFKVSPTEVQKEERINTFHAPYHNKLNEIINSKIEKFGHAWLVDAHSVPSRANLLHGQLEDDIFLGTRDGQSCSPTYSAVFEEFFRGYGYKVSMNSPYKGGYITHHYGQMEGVEALQIEMAQRVYMEEGDRPLAERDGGKASQDERFRRTRADLLLLFERLLA